MFIPPDGNESQSATHDHLCPVAAMMFYPKSLQEIWYELDADFRIRFTRPIFVSAPFNLHRYIDDDQHKEDIAEFEQSLTLPSWVSLFNIGGLGDSQASNVLEFSYEDETTTLDQIRELALDIFTSLLAMEPTAQVIEPDDWRPRTPKELAYRQRILSEHGITQTSKDN